LIESKRNRFKILSRDKFRCIYCGFDSMDGTKLDVDHVVPVRMGGTTSYGNLVTSCRDCNRGKSGYILPPNIEKKILKKVNRRNISCGYDHNEICKINHINKSEYKKYKHVRNENEILFSDLSNQLKDYEYKRVPDIIRNTHLTLSEKRILTLLAIGFTYQDISKQLGISCNSVTSHFAAAKRKYFNN